MKSRKKRKKAVKKLNWWDKTKENLLAACNCVKDAFLNSVRKVWNMLLDDSYGLAWGGIAFGALTLLNVLNPWDLLAILSIGLGIRHLWVNHRFH